MSKRKLRQTTGVEEALEDDHNFHDGKEPTGFDPQVPGGRIIGAIAELARCQWKYDAPETEHNQTMELVSAARDEYDALRSYVADMEGKCERYKRERDDDRIDYATTYQERDELLRKVAELEATLSEQSGCGT